MIPHYIMMNRSMAYERIEESSDGEIISNITIDKLEKVTSLLNRASLTFMETMNSNSSKCRELLEEAFRAYVD